MTRRFAGLILLAAVTLAACEPLTSLPSTPSPLTVTAAASAIPAPTITPTADTLPETLIHIAPESLRGVQIKVWHAFTGPTADLFRAQFADFNTLNPWGIVVFSAAQGNYTALFEAVNASLSTESQPDMVIALPEQILAWDASGAVTDLTSYVRDARYGLSAQEIADIPAAFWAQDEVNGRRLGVPAQRTARFLVYNQTWGRELGFQSPPVTAAEFRQQACAANAAFRADADETNDGYGGWIVESDPLTAYTWLLAYGGGVTGASGYAFSSDANRAALENLKSLFDDHCAWLAEDPGPYYDRFARRSAFFISASLAELPVLVESLSQAGSADEWTVIPFPGQVGAALVAYGPSAVVLLSTPEKQLASWLFARWMLSAENQARWVQADGLFPLRLSALGLLGGYRAAHPQWEVAVGYLSQAQITPQLASWRLVKNVLADGFFSVFRTDVALEGIPAVLDEMDLMAEEISKP